MRKTAIIYLVVFWVAAVSATLINGDVMAVFRPKVRVQRHYTITNAVELAPLPNLINQFLASECIEENTLKAYRQALEMHFITFCVATLRKQPGSLSYSDVTRKLISDFEEARAEVEMPSSVRLRLRILKAFCAWVAERHFVANPALGYQLDDDENEEFKGLEDRQYRALIRCARGQKRPLDRYVPQLLVYTGARNDEARRLTLAQFSRDLDWLNRVVGKGGRKRDIPICDQLRREHLVFMWWREDFPEQPEYPLLWSERGSSRGNPGLLSNKTIWRIVHDVAIEAGIPEELAHPHALRHTFAYRTLDHLERRGVKAGRALIMLRDLMGHRSINTTMKYLGNRSEDLEELMKELQ